MKKMQRPSGLADPSVLKADFEANSFVSAGVACFAFSLLDTLGLIDVLVSHGGFSIKI